MSVVEKLVEWVEKYNPEFKEEYERDCASKYNSVLCGIGHTITMNTKCSDRQKRKLEARMIQHCE